MKLHIHQTQQTIAEFSQIFSYLKQAYEKSASHSLHLFPELFLTGYPLQDLCLQDSFVQKYLDLLQEINTWSKNLSDKQDTCFLLGGLKYDNYDSRQQNYQIRNVVYKLIPGKELEAVYTKHLLPNYDIFDERKYYWTGKEPFSLEWCDRHIGVLICEDMWPSTFYDHDPSQMLFEHYQNNKVQPDLIVNLSASPFALGKQENRVQRGMELSHQFGCPFAYSNRVGAEDEIIFDGSSFIVDAKNKKMAQLKSFVADELIIDIEKSNQSQDSDYQSNPEHVWQSLFTPKLDLSKKPAQLISLSDEQIETSLEAIQFSLQEYATKNGFKKFLIALSGGMDSALALTIARMSLKDDQSLEAIYMPSQYSASLSYDLSFELCQNLGVKLTTLPIKFMHSTARNMFSQYFKTPLEGVADENIQSRLRGTLLYARSNQTGSMVINTSNKSEIAVGYSTQYGDSVGALSILGDLFKSEIYQIAEFINKKYNKVIPEGIITRPASAELREDQQDSQTLPPYDVLDAILEAILSYQYSKSEILDLGFNQEDVEKVFHLYRISEFKRYQFCPIVKLKMKSFGFGYRLPISKNNYIYT